jgi:hypothetical protein
MALHGNRPLRHDIYTFSITRLHCEYLQASSYIALPWFRCCFFPLGEGRGRRSFAGLES